MVANLLQSFAAQTASLANQAVTRAQAQGVPLSFAPQRFYAGPLSQAVIDDLIGQGFVYDYVSQGFTPPPGYQGSAEDFLQGVRNAEARQAPPPAPPPAQIQPPSLPGAGLLPVAAPPQQITPPSLPGGGLATTGVGGGGVAFSQSTGYGTVGTEQERLRQAQIAQGLYRDEAAMSEYAMTLPPAQPSPYRIDQQAPPESLRGELLAERGGETRYGSILEPLAPLADLASQAFEPIAPVVSAIGQGAQNFAEIPFISAPAPQRPQGAITPATLGQTAVSQVTPIPALERGQEWLQRQAEQVPIIGQPLGLATELIVPTSPLELALAPTGLGLAGDVTDVARLARGGAGLVRGGVETAGDIAQAGARGLGAPQGVGYFGGLPTGPGDDLMAQLEASLRMTPEELRVRGAEAARETEQASRLAQRQTAEPFRNAAIERQLVNQMGGIPPAPVRGQPITQADLWAGEPPAPPRTPPALPQAPLRGPVPRFPEGFARTDTPPPQPRPVTPPPAARTPEARGRAWETAASSGGIPPRTPKEYGGMTYGPEWNSPKATKIRDRITDELAALAGLPRTLKASFDLSAPGRQGLALGARHPVEWLQSWAPMLKAWGSPQGLADANAEIDRIMTPWRTWLGDDFVHFYEVGQAAEATSRVPSFETAGPGWLSSAVRSVPGLQRSERAYATFLNMQKAKTFSNMADALYRAGDRNGNHYINQANIIDHATGFGAVPLKGRQLGQVFFSQRYLTSRFQFLVDPIVEGVAKGDLRAAKAATENLVAFAGGAAGLAFLINESGIAEVELDPRSSDFGKIRIGPMRIDFGAGFLPIIRTATRMATGQGVSSTGGVYDIDAEDAFLGFFRNKLAPLPSELVTRYTGENPIGEAPSLNPLQIARDMFMPLIADAVLEAYKETDDPLMAALAGVTELVGGGVTTYTTTGEKTNAAIAEALGAGNTYTNAAGEEVPYPTTYLDADGQPQPVKSLADLRAADPLAAEDFNNKHPELTEERLEAASPTSQRITEIKEGALAEQTARDETLLGTNPAEWRSQSSEGGMITAAAIRERAEDFEGTPEAKTLLATTLDAYFAAIEESKSATGQIDWESVDRAIVDMSPEQKQLLLANRIVGETPARADYIRALEMPEMEGYFNVRDEAWAMMSAGDAELEQYKTLDDFRQSLIVELHDGGYGWSEAQAKADGYLDKLSEKTGRLVKAYLAENADLLLPVLDKYDFYIPASLRPYVRRDVDATPTPAPMAPPPNTGGAVTSEPSQLASQMPYLTSQLAPSGPGAELIADRNLSPRQPGLASGGQLLPTYTNPASAPQMVIYEDTARGISVEYNQATSHYSVIDTRTGRSLPITRAEAEHYLDLSGDPGAVFAAMLNGTFGIVTPPGIANTGTVYAQ